MAEEREINTGGGSYIGGDVESGRDVIGRDQIIQNILVVRQFLDFAKLSDLLPQLDLPIDYEQVSVAFEDAFGDEAGQELAYATSFAGEILRDLVSELRPKDQFAAFPYSKMLDDLAPAVIDRLHFLGHWDVNSTPLDDELAKLLRFTISSKPRILWLTSLEQLWENRYSYESRFGFLEGKEYYSSKNSRAMVFFGPENSGKIEDHDWGQDYLHTIFAGVVIDLVRIGSLHLSDKQFWARLVEFLGR